MLYPSNVFSRVRSSVGMYWFVNSAASRWLRNWSNFDGKRVRPYLCVDVIFSKSSNSPGDVVVVTVRGAFQCDSLSLMCPAVVMLRSLL